MTIIAPRSFNKFLSALWLTAVFLLGQEGPSRIAVVNKGQPGENTQQALGVLNRDVLSVKPAAVVIYFGMNDCVNSGNSVALDAFRENLETMVKKSVAGDIWPILVTVTPVIESYVLGRHKKEFFGEDGPNGKITKYNRAIQGIASAQKIPCVDANALFKAHGEPTEDVASYIRNQANSNVSDGVHYTSKGNEALASAVYAVLKGTLKKGDTVVCFGDSLTFSYGVKGAGTSTGDSYPARLAALLNGEAAP